MLSFGAWTSAIVRMDIHCDGITCKNSQHIFLSCLQKQREPTYGSPFKDPCSPLHYDQSYSY